MDINYVRPFCAMRSVMLLQGGPLLQIPGLNEIRTHERATAHHYFVLGQVMFCERKKDCDLSNFALPLTLATKQVVLICRYLTSK